MSVQGWADFAWSSSYSQFYLIDCEDYGTFRAPEDTETVSKNCHAPPAGLVVYTKDCLQQHVRIRIHDREPEMSPVEEWSGNAWTAVETVRVTFPSRRFTISSPGYPDTRAGGPVFTVGSETMMARITWMEFDGVRDDTVPVAPDVIEVTLWPAQPQ